MSDFNDFSNISKTFSQIFRPNELFSAMKVVTESPFIRKENLLEGKLSITSGTATYPEDGHNAENLIKSAGKKMYS